MNGQAKCFARETFVAAVGGFRWSEGPPKTGFLGTAGPVRQPPFWGNSEAKGLTRACIYELCALDE